MKNLYPYHLYTEISSSLYCVDLGPNYIKNADAFSVYTTTRFYNEKVQL